MPPTGGTSSKTKSPTSTSSTATKPEDVTYTFALREAAPPVAADGLTVKDICAILEQSKKLGVARIRFYGVEVYFSPDAEDFKEADSPRGPYDFREVPEAPVSKHAPQTLMTTADVAAQDEAMRAQMMIDDPVAYEDLMIAESLEHHRGETLAQG